MSNRPKLESRLRVGEFLPTPPSLSYQMWLLLHEKGKSPMDYSPHASLVQSSQTHRVH
ncbi:Uncharacterised protein [Vibrio cholerae]|nr:Uncharacterised protein [Vibrio cholerae]